MATECSSRGGFSFQPKIAWAFDGGTITGDAGLLAVRELDERLRLTAALHPAIGDGRDRRYVTHEVLPLVRQRLYQLIAGYEDANDATYARHDPALQTVAARLGAPLASQPTLSRFENAADWATIRRLAAVGRRWFVQHGLPHPRASRELVVDIDSTDDPTHGQQCLSFYNGHYDEHMYHPLLAFVGGYLVAARLRPGDVAGATHLWPMLAPVLRDLRRARPQTALAVRADSAFAQPALLAALERVGVTYAIGMTPNRRLYRAVARAQARARAAFERTGRPHRGFTSFRYRATRWPARLTRRVLAMVEHGPLGPNVRFVVTNRRGRAAEIFHWYHQRGDAENWIKALKYDLAADRLSCHAYRANAFRLQLHALAYNMLWLFRARLLAGTPLATATLGTLRLRVLKVAARVVKTARRWWFHLATGWPGQPLFVLVHTRLAGLSP